MTITSGSKRVDLVREFFYWATFLRAVDKLDNLTYGAIVGALITTYLANRTITEYKSTNAPKAKQATLLDPVGEVKDNGTM